MKIKEKHRLRIIKVIMAIMKDEGINGEYGEDFVVDSYESDILDSIESLVDYLKRMEERELAERI